MADQATHQEDHRVFLQGSTKHHGISLWPPPSNNPKDPLRWPRWLKIVALIVASLCNFTANFAGSGLSVAIPLFEMQFRKSAFEVNGLLTFNFLLLGLGNLFWVPVAVKFGKRVALISSMAILFAFLCWTTTIHEFNSLLAARCITGFASAAGESIVPGIVSDLFFLHERAGMMSIYVILISSATAIGPLIAGYMLQYSPGTWHDFVWVSAALAGFNLLLLIFLLPESNFHRPVAVRVILNTGESLSEDGSKGDVSHLESDGKQLEARLEPNNNIQHVDAVRVPWSSIWSSYGQVDHQTSFWMVLVRPIFVLIHPALLWAVLIYGASLAAQVIIIFALPNLLIPPPYLFTSSQVGLMQVAALIGFLIGTFMGGYLADIITVKRIIKEGGVAYPEQRLVALIPGCLIGPAGCILIAFACSEKLHWVAIAFGFGMVSFGTIFAPNIAITYIVERYREIAAESLVMINAFKNLVAFIFLYVAVDWIQAKGWVEVYMIMFMLSSVTLLAAIPLYIWGEKLESWAEKTSIHRKFISTGKKLEGGEEM